jgi:glutamyl-Q tRNA(Asp) synthetase
MTNTTSRGQITQYLAVPTINVMNLPRGCDSIATRFAPSPNGYLHMGHAYAAIAAHDFARRYGGKFYLRIEDIDGTRSRPEYIDAILADLEWLGLSWDIPPILQSGRINAYSGALDQLKADGLVYRCFCSRQDIRDAVRKTPVLHGPDGPVYPGTCSGLSITEAEQRARNEPHQWRLDMATAIERCGPLKWNDAVTGEQFADVIQFGDVVLWRKDAPASYHLAATLDDARDGITHVVRGRDLFAYSAIHRVLQALLNLPQPIYWHHPVLITHDGDKLSKSKRSPSLSMRRMAGEDGLDLSASLRAGVLPPELSLSPM